MDKDLFLLEKELEQLLRHSQHVANQLDSLREDEEEQRSHLAKLDGDLSGCIKEKEEIQRRVAEKEVKVEELEHALDETKESLSQVLLRYNQYREEEKGLIREKERLGQFIREVGIRISKIEQEIHSNRDLYESSLSTEREVKGELKVIYQRQEGLDKEVNELEHGFETVREELGEEEKKTALLREGMSEIREKINDARIRDAEMDFQVRAIVSQVAKEVGIDLQREHKRYLEEDFSKADYEIKLNDYRRSKERMGEVNLLAINDYEKLQERYEFITAQQQDLLSSIDSLDNAIRRINRISKELFLSTLGKVDERLRKVFPILFDGGRARLRLLDENLPLESGVLMEVQPPGKRLVHMGLLSGGEKALAAMALLFAIYLIRPSPFIIMDEVDAPLDDANTDRFNNLLGEIKKSSQVIIVTHNRRTMEMSERLYGVAMDKSNVSKIVSVDLEDYR
jgi:chromosome segregation protein